MLIYWLQHQRFLFKVFCFYFTTIPGDFICSSLWNICFFLRKLTESQVHPVTELAPFWLRAPYILQENHCLLTLKGIKGIMYCVIYYFGYLQTRCFLIVLCTFHLHTATWTFWLGTSSHSMSCSFFIQKHYVHSLRKTE